MTHKPLSKFVLWLKRMKDKLTIDPKYVYPLVCFQWGCSEKGDKPDLTSVWYQFGRGPRDRSLFWNGVIFLRITFPLGLFWSIRWTSKPVKRQYLQTGFGYKVNGQFSLTFRFQNDGSAADGTYGKNVGQSSGWQCGSK